MAALSPFHADTVAWFHAPELYPLRLRPNVCNACHLLQNCPLYRGPKRLGSLLTEPTEKKKRRRGIGNEVDLLLAAETGLEGTGSMCSANTRVVSPRRRRNENSSAIGGSSDTSDSEDEDDLEDDGARGDGQDSGDAYDSALDDDQFSDDAEESGRGGRGSKSAVSRSSRSLLQRKRGRNAGGGDVDGDAQQPIDALNVAFARVVNVLLQQQTFKVSHLLRFSFRPTVLGGRWPRRGRKPIASLPAVVLPSDLALLCSAACS